MYKTALEDVPLVEIAVHNIGDVWLTVTNVGQFGTGWIGSSIDPVTGMEAPSCVFPASSDLSYLYVGSFWLGAISGRDTLVSIGVDDYYQVLELWPNGTDGIERRSIQTNSPLYDIDAKSEQDIIAVYTDTLTNPEYVEIDQNENHPHIPLNIEITQRSYGWSYEYARDFILFDYSIKNIGINTLNQVYMGIYVDGDVHHESEVGGYTDDLVGFKRAYPTSYLGCEYLDTINIAYIMDNDGDPDPETSTFSSNSPLGAAGVRVVRTPSDSLKYSFNWWFVNFGDITNEFGPRRAGTEEDPFRDMDGHLGTPLGDANKYYVLRHEEFDYDQLFTGVDHTGDGWLPRPPTASDFANGNDVVYLLSFGPFNIQPGEVLPLSFAWVMGDNVHKDPNDFKNYFDYTEPDFFYNTLDFSDLAANSRWASWIYDNPGVDTDGDGDFGRFRLCLSDSEFVMDSLGNTIGWEYIYDTIYYIGDGVPDFKGASPPPAPELWVIDQNGDTLGTKIRPHLDSLFTGELVIRWNGFRSETEKDVFSNEYDFEGYRIYTSTTPDPSGFSLMASYDREDYNRYVWDPGLREYVLRETPFTIDSLRSIYGEDFSPLDYDRNNLFRWNEPGTSDTFYYYFEPQDWNQSDLTSLASIHKAYPEITEPPTILNIEQARIYYPEELTEDGLFFKYYEYEFIMDNLLPSQLYYIAVTAFDYGSPQSGLQSLETQPFNNFVYEYPNNQTAYIEEQIAQSGLNVVVYPNPYIGDDRYLTSGFEGSDYINGNGDLINQDNLIRDRTHQIHFENLPSQCTIRIFTSDGDLDRIIEHDIPRDIPQSSHERWDLISRNTQLVVSGIYYYTIESKIGNQIGTLVIIL
ncbi:MAG: hypothetical protein ABIJ45_14260 [Candidatus Zixiibacteriota bacterium]